MKFGNVKIVEKRLDSVKHSPNSNQNISKWHLVFINRSTE